MQPAHENMIFFIKYEVLNQDIIFHVLADLNNKTKLHRPIKYLHTKMDKPFVSKKST